MDDLSRSKATLESRRGFEVGLDARWSKACHSLEKSTHTKLTTPLLLRGENNDVNSTL